MLFPDLIVVKEQRIQLHAAIFSRVLQNIQPYDLPQRVVVFLEDRQVHHQAWVHSLQPIPQLLQKTLRARACHFCFRGFRLGGFRWHTATAPLLRRFGVLTLLGPPSVALSTGAPASRSVPPGRLPGIPAAMAPPAVAAPGHGGPRLSQPMTEVIKDLSCYPRKVIESAKSLVVMAFKKRKCEYSASAGLTNQCNT